MFLNACLYDCAFVCSSQGSGESEWSLFAVWGELLISRYKSKPSAKSNQMKKSTSGERRKKKEEADGVFFFSLWLFPPQTWTTHTRRRRSPRASTEACTLIWVVVLFLLFPPFVPICPPLQVFHFEHRLCPNMLGRPTCLCAFSVFPQSTSSFPSSLPPFPLFPPEPTLSLRPRSPGKLLLLQSDGR